MNCQEMVDFILAYLEEQLPEGERAEFQRHMNDCPPCLDYLESYKQTIELGKSACCEPDAAIPEDVPERLIQAILAARRSSDT